MPTQIGIGFSQDMDTATAAREAAVEAQKKLNQGRIDIAFVFSTVHYNPNEFLPILYEALDRTKIVGCSTSGIIIPERIEHRGIGILAISSDSIRFETGAVTHLDLQDIQEAGKVLAQNSITDFGSQHRKLFFFFVDGLNQGISSLAKGAKEKLGQLFPIWGVGASDNFHFEQTHQFQNNQVISRGAAGVLIGGRGALGISCRHGWKPLGKPRSVDAVQGNVIKTIDGRPPFQLYREYFEQQADGMKKSRIGHINVRYPLGFSAEDHGEYALRNVMDVLDDGSVVCQDTISGGTNAHIMLGNQETCFLAAGEAAEDVKAQLEGRKPSVILVFESMMRYKLMGRTALRELRLIRNTIDPEVPVFGMYSCGEVYSSQRGAHVMKTSFTNNSLIILALG